MPSWPLIPHDSLRDSPGMMPCDTKGGRVPTAPKRSADLARHPDLESGTFYGIVKPDEVVKVTFEELPDCWLSFYRFLSAPLRVTATTKTRTNKALQSKSESWCGSGRNALDVAHLSHNAKNRLEPPWADARRLCPPGGRGPLLKKRISPQPLPIRGTPFGRPPGHCPRNQNAF